MANLRRGNHRSKRQRSPHKPNGMRHRNEWISGLERLLRKPSQMFTEIFVAIAVGVVAKLLEPALIEVIKYLF